MILYRSIPKTRKSLTAFCAILGPAVVWLTPALVRSPWNQSRVDLPTDQPGAHETLMAESEDNLSILVPVVLVPEEPLRGGLRERIRERRESRAGEKARQNDPLASQESNAKAPSRRITGERVQLWIEQLRDRIRDGIGNSGENSSLQTQVSPVFPSVPLVPNGSPFSAGPLPIPTLPQNKPSSSATSETPQITGQQDVGAPGPELVVPQILPPKGDHAETPTSRPQNTTQTSESGQTLGTADSNTQTPNNPAVAGEDATGLSGSSQGQPSGKPSGLTGILSNVGKILGSGYPAGQQATKDGVEPPASATSPIAGEQRTADGTPNNSKTPTTTRKTLAEIRKQILLKQSQEATKVAK